MSEWLKINNVGRFICGNFIPTGTAYDFGNDNTVPITSSLGPFYTGWDNEIIPTPSDSTYAIRLSNGSPIILRYFALFPQSYGLKWSASNKAPDSPGGLPIEESFVLYETTGNPPNQGLQAVTQVDGVAHIVSGFLPRQYNYLILRPIRISPGGPPGEFPDIIVQGEFGFLAPSPNCLKITNVGTNICAANPTNCIKIKNTIKNPPTWDIGIQISEPNQTFSINLLGTSPNITIDWGDGTRQTLTDANIHSKIYTSAGNYTIKIFGSFANNGNIRLGNTKNQREMVISTSIIPNIPGLNSFEETFRESKLTQIPPNLFINNPTATNFQACLNSCKLIESIPSELFANNTLATNFSNCFAGCNNITLIPVELFSNNTAVTDFAGCFFNCASLTSIPENLFANNTAVTNFTSCFYLCGSLTSIPENLFANNTAVTTFEQCFLGCTSLTSVPANLFANNTAVTDFGGCFFSCSSLTSVPSTLFANNTVATSFRNCFSNCSSLTSVPSTLFANNTAATDFESCFLSCYLIESIPPELFANNIIATNFESCFSQCISLTSVPSTLFANNTAATSFNNCFSSCSSLTSVPSTLFANNTAVTDFGGCFDNITLTATSYSNLLINIASNSQQRQNNVIFGANLSKYNSSAIPAINILFAKNWIILDAGEAIVVSLPSPNSLQSENILHNGFTARWNHITSSSTPITGYALDVSTSNSFNNFVNNYNNLIIPFDLWPFLDISGLNQNTTYYWRVRNLGSDSQSSNSLTRSVTTVNMPGGQVQFAVAGLGTGTPGLYSKIYRSLNYGLTWNPIIVLDPTVAYSPRDYNKIDIDQSGSSIIFSCPGILNCRAGAGCDDPPGVSIPGPRFYCTDGSVVMSFDSGNNFISECAGKLDQELYFDSEGNQIGGVFCCESRWHDVSIRNATIGGYKSAIALSTGYISTRTKNAVPAWGNMTSNKIDNMMPGWNNNQLPKISYKAELSKNSDVIAFIGTMNSMTYDTKGDLVLSLNNGLSWPVVLANNVRDIAITADGKTVIGVDGSRMFAIRNTNATTNISDQVGIPGASLVSISYNGRYQAIAAFDSLLDNRVRAIYTSENYGKTGSWVQRLSINPDFEITSIKVSSDGQYQTAVTNTILSSNGGNIYRSANYGRTWSLLPYINTWKDVAIN